MEHAQHEQKLFLQAGQQPNMVLYSSMLNSLKNAGKIRKLSTLANFGQQPHVIERVQNVDIFLEISEYIVEAELLLRVALIGYFIEVHIKQVQLFDAADEHRTCVGLDLKLTCRLSIQMSKDICAAIDEVLDSNI